MDCQIYILNSDQYIEENPHPRSSPRLAQPSPPSRASKATLARGLVGVEAEHGR